MMRTFTVYRYYDANDRPLYVGYSAQFKVRHSGHKSSSSWFDRVSRFEVEEFFDQDAALDREADLIQSLRPEFNRSQRRGRYPVRAVRVNMSFRLSAKAREILEYLSDANGVTKTAYLEMAIRQEAERQDVK